MTNVIKIYPNLDTLCCRTFDVAETLMLLHQPTPSIFWSWGVELKLNYKNMGLLLKVNAHRHTGWLLISLSFSDLYDVYLFEDEKIKDEIKGLYFDQLLKAIDDKIEKLDNYEF
ncbi:hypothetical protein E0W68_02210 [Flavobacterium salilacus subsp. salilacus]|uniref:hypothetical protein n=1 Tax=Flavobacterium TaxID=237 RepID=UPI0010755D1C|nr:MULTISPECIES: hypothetical protein [Flavobacterium]KAF2520056.1 hypothetical protein E0W68_02210 [Flavobacterium salilacus subsp. salilacus]MBE1614028.1 hypothetical protein [Flavobacterium sp. SaA2.13]